MTAAADVIRAPVTHRVDNEVAGASVATHRHRRSDRSRPVLPLSGVAARTVAPPQLHRHHFAVRAAAHRAAWGRRPVRDVRREDGKSGVEARRALSPGIRHSAYGLAGYRHDSWLSVETSKATAASGAHAPEDPIFHVVEPGADPRPARCAGRDEHVDAAIAFYGAVKNAIAAVQHVSGL